MAETHPIRRLGTRAALLSIGLALGVTLAPRVVGAVDLPAPTADTATTVPATVEAAATTTTTGTGSTSTTTSSSTSTSTSTSTTTIATTPPPTDPPELVPPLVVDFRQPAEVADALRVSREVATARRASSRAVAGAAELPFTGGGTLSILISGFMALAIGTFAVWWGSRRRPELVPVETSTSTTE